MRHINDILHFIVQKYSYGNINYNDLIAVHYFFNGLETVVELGTCMGTTTELLSQLCGQVTTVDIFEKISLIEDAGERELYRTNFGNNNNSYSRIAGRFKSKTNVDIIQAVSYKAATEFPDNSLDAIFIDADHSYEGVKKDYEHWFSKVKKGGFFVFHDIYNGSEVKRYYEKRLCFDPKINEVRMDDHPMCTVRGFEKCELS